MLMIFKRQTVIFTALIIIVVLAAMVWGISMFKDAFASGFNYRVFVAGIGTVEGKWCGDTGIAVIGVETRPAPEKGYELKLIDLLVANSSSGNLVFNPDISLVNNEGKKYGLKAHGQPEVIVKAGNLSQGTIIISVPEGIPDKEWQIEIKGGNLKEGIMLPLRVMKVVVSDKR